MPPLALTGDTLCHFRSRGSPFWNLRRRATHRPLRHFRDGACRNAGVAIPCCRHVHHVVARPPCCGTRVAVGSAVPRYVFHCGLGCAEIYDFFTDGQQIAQAYLCDGDIHGSWVLIFQQAHSLALPVVERLHMAGIMALSQTVAVGLQGLLMLDFTDAGGKIHMVCNLVGLGGLEKSFMTEGVEEIRFIYVYRAITVGLFETLSELMLQPSLFALTLEHTDETSRKKQLSLVITWSTTLNMVKGVLHGLKRIGQELREADVAGGCCFSCVFVIPSVVFTLGALAAMIVGMMRVYHASMCDGHLWNLFFLGAWSSD